MSTPKDNIDWRLFCDFCHRWGHTAPECPPAGRIPKVLTPTIEKLRADLDAAFAAQGRAFEAAEMARQEIMRISAALRLAKAPEVTTARPFEIFDKRGFKIGTYYDYR